MKRPLLDSLIRESNICVLRAIIVSRLRLFRKITPRARNSQLATSNERGSRRHVGTPRNSVRQPVGRTFDTIYFISDHPGTPRKIAVTARASERGHKIAFESLTLPRPGRRVASRESARVKASNSPVASTCRLPSCYASRDSAHASFVP